MLCTSFKNIKTIFYVSLFAYLSLLFSGNVSANGLIEARCEGDNGVERWNALISKKNRVAFNYRLTGGKKIDEDRFIYNIGIDLMTDEGKRMSQKAALFKNRNQNFFYWDCSIPFVFKNLPKITLIKDNDKGRNSAYMGLNPFVYTSLDLFGSKVLPLNLTKLLIPQKNGGMMPDNWRLCRTMIQMVCIKATASQQKGKLYLTIGKTKSKEFNEVSELRLNLPELLHRPYLGNSKCQSIEIGSTHYTWSCANKDDLRLTFGPYIKMPARVKALLQTLKLPNSNGIVNIIKKLRKKDYYTRKQIVSFLKNELSWTKGQSNKLIQKIHYPATHRAIMLNFTENSTQTLTATELEPYIRALPSSSNSKDKKLIAVHYRIDQGNWLAAVVSTETNLSWLQHKTNSHSNNVTYQLTYEDKKEKIWLSEIMTQQELVNKDHRFTLSEMLGGDDCISAEHLVNPVLLKLNLEDDRLLYQAYKSKAALAVYHAPSCSGLAFVLRWGSYLSQTATRYISFPKTSSAERPTNGYVTIADEPSGDFRYLFPMSGSFTIASGSRCYEIRSGCYYKRTNTVLIRE